MRFALRATGGFVLVANLAIVMAQENLRGSGNAQLPVAPFSTPDATTPIHLSISAFKDGERCARTLRLALENAERPERLSFAVLQARDGSDTDCIGKFKEHHTPELCNGNLANNNAYGSAEDCAAAVMKQIVSKVIAPAEGEGPGHQRGLMDNMVAFNKPDMFCMQTDSHMDFLSNWDSLLTDEWSQTHNEFAVLTAYVMDISSKGPYAMNHMVDCCGWALDGDGVPRGNGCGDVPRVETPQLTMNWAAGFSFHRCHAEQNVPVDRNLEWIFTGEEVDRAARLWTSGYDLYLPTRGFVLHDYSHASQTFWRYDKGDQDEKAQASRTKLWELLELHNRHSSETAHTGHYYTLGKQRSLQQWKEFIAPAYNKGTQFCTRDVRLKRIPVADPQGLALSASSPDATHEL